jgi:protein-S-isoprenylcysteine O-methyltransferase Ste14
LFRLAHPSGEAGLTRRTGVGSWVVTDGAAFFATPLPWRAAFWVSFGAWCVLEGWVFSRDRRPASGVDQDRGSLRVLGVAIALSLFVAFFAAAAFRGFALPTRSLLLAGGLAIAWAGLALRLWSVLTLGRFFRVTVRVQDEHRLVEAGPYRVLRNPSYTGAMLTLVGLGLAMGNAVSLAVLVLGPLVGYAQRIRVEDAALAARFGAAYQDYRRRTWALVPFVW